MAIDARGLQGAVKRPAPASAAHAADDQPEGHLERKAWFRFIRKWSLVFWLAVSVAGIVAAVFPASYPAKVLLSSAIVGAGIAGLMSEFTFCLDRRDSDFDLQVQRYQYVGLEGQVSQVDGLVKKTEIISINQLFKLGIELYQIRFLSADQAAVFRVEVEELADILRLSDAVYAFLAHPYLHASATHPEGQDPFPALRAAVELRYAQEGVEALKAGSTIGTIMHTAGGLTDKGYRENALSILKDALKLLYLLPEVYDNILRAIEGLEDGTRPPGNVGGYLSLFFFYMTFRMTGENPDVAPLFESPVSLDDEATIAEIRRLLSRLAGQPPEGPEPPSAAEPEPATVTAAAPTSTGQKADRQPWFRYVRIGSLVFWLAVTTAGLVIALVPVNYAIKVLISSAVVGAGIAGMMSEFTFCFDRRDADTALRDQRRRYASLRRHIGQVDTLVKRSDIIAINQLFQLGQNLYLVRFGDESRVADSRSGAVEIADFLGLSVAIRTFLDHPNLRPTEPLPPEQDPFPALINAVSLRHAQEGLQALKAGLAFGLVLSSGLADEGIRATAAQMLRQAITVLYLCPEAYDNMRRAIDGLEDGSCDPSHFLWYLTLFSFYLGYRMTGRLAEVAPLFESPVSLAEPPVLAKVHRILAQIAGEPEDAPGTATPVPEAREPEGAQASGAVPSGGQAAS